MTSFVPLNIIPDSDSEGEIDNTEEIQIEEALKLYTRALKLHTEGNWEEASKAYDDLFRSEIFAIDVDEQVHAQNRTATSSLPLVHYLAYKNHGAFKLDRLQTVLEKTSPEEVQAEVAQALEWFATALCRDAGDSFLWRETAQLAVVVQSARLARFALESVLDHQTVGADAAKDSLSLVAGGYQNPEDQLALAQLKKMLEQISDTVALSAPKIQSTSKRKLNSKFAKALNPLPWLPQPAPEEKRTLAEDIQAFSDTREEVTVEARSWPAVGKALLERLPKWVDEDELPDVPVGHLKIHLILPDGDDDSRATTPDQETPAEDEAKTEAAGDDSGDVAMSDATHTLLTTDLVDRRKSGTGSRKRKSTSMGPDAARSRLSKRQRDKKEAEEAAAAAAAATPEQTEKEKQLSQEEKFFTSIDSHFSPYGVSLGTAAALRFKPPPTDGDADAPDTTAGKADLYIEDFKAIVQSFDDTKGNVLLYGDGIQSPAEAAQGMKFLDTEHPAPTKPALTDDIGLKRLIRDIHKRGMSPSEAAFSWLRTLCRRAPEEKRSKTSTTAPSSPSAGVPSYLKHLWPESLKSIAQAIAAASEEMLYRHFRTLEKQLLTRTYHDLTPDDLANIEWAETTLELYIDSLAQLERLRLGGDITPESNDDLIILRDRVFRWFHLVGDLIQCRPRDEDGQIEEDDLTLRYLWASAVITGFSEPSREFRLACFEDMKNLLKDKKPVELPNCSIMSEVSSARAEREISKLKTVDFFSTIFTATEDGEKEPEDVIDLLEAVLEPGKILPYDEEEERILVEISRFLEGSSSMFKLHLWEKLRSAYAKLDMPEKILSISLRCLDIIMSELNSRHYRESPPEYRQFMVLRSVRLGEQLVRNTILPALKGGSEVLEKLEEEEVRSALGSIRKLLRVAHCFGFWEQAVQKGEYKMSDLHAYRLTQTLLREMMVECWVVAYRVYEGLLKRDDLDDEERNEKLGSLLRDVHEELGGRGYCKLDHHVFLKLVHEELLKFNDHQFDGDLLQVLHCRFHLTVGQDLYYFHDHRTDAEPLTRAHALELLDFFMFLARQKKIKELVKSDIKVGLDRLIDVLGVPRKQGNARIAHNDAMIEQYLRSSINPLAISAAFKGALAVSTIDILGDYAEIARKGLYFLLGKITLYPLKHLKKTAMLKIEDVEACVKHFKNNLVCNPESWEAWYRIAQVFEIQTEELQTWNADAINTRRPDLVIVERRCILAYMMAVSLAISNHPTPETNTKEVNQTLSELFSDFGFRIYGAARPPMAMESFWIDDFERHFSGRCNEGMYRDKPHIELQFSGAMKLAYRLFSLSHEFSPTDNWKTFYMLGKCLGKIDKDREKARASAEEKGTKFDLPQINVKEILEHYIRAIENAPEKVGNEYIFEPHHKLVSATTKYVLASRLPAIEACQLLQASHFARRIETVEDQSAFVPYAIEILKKMKQADKSKWHHRMTYRLSRLRYVHLHDAAGARHELNALFGAKTAAISIWRPEHERPGRHFVYASTYTMFYATLLKEVNDRAMLELLAKRVRRGVTTLFRHADVWAHVFDAYITVLRATSKLPVGMEDRVFSKLVIEEFVALAAKIEAFYTAAPANAAASKPVELLREVYELRKINGALAKNTRIDDLFADAYAWVFETGKCRVGAGGGGGDERMSLRNLIEEGPRSGVRVQRRDVVSKAGGLCKELANIGVAGGVGRVEKREGEGQDGDESRVEETGDEGAGEESRLEDSRMDGEDSRMEDTMEVETGAEEGDDEDDEGEGDEMMLDRDA